MMGIAAKIWLLVLMLCAVLSAGAQTTAAPVFTLPTGRYVMPQSTTVTDTTAGASIVWCFTAAGSCTPATAYTGPIYINPVSVDILCARASASGMAQSQVVCATYTAASSTAAAAPTFSLGTGTYAGMQTVTLASASPGAEIFYTLDGSTPDFTSTLYTGPIRITGTATVKAIAGVVGAQSIDEDNSTANWKGVETCFNDNPGGCTGTLNATRPPDYNCCTPTAASSPGGAIVTGAACLPGGDGTCMEFSQTPLANHQTNALWPRTSTQCDRCTWFVSKSHVFYGPNSAKASAFEHDQQDFDKTDNYNMQFGMQCKTCTGSANWQIGGTTNTPWISTGITQQFAANAWHSIVKEDHWNLAELTSKPCSSGGTHFPCQYYTKLILDGHSYDMQDPSMCPNRPAGSAGTGCTITSDNLETGFGSNVSDQYQIDGVPTATPVSLNTRIDGASFTAFYDPSPVSTVTYTVNPVTASLPVTVTTAPPSLVSVYLGVPGNVTTLTDGSTLQFTAYCHYALGHDQNCSVADIYGDKVTSWASSNAATLTIGAAGSAAAGIATALGVGPVTVSATVNGNVASSAYGLTVQAPSVVLTNVSLATAGGVTSIGVGGTNQLTAICTYSDGSTTHCNTADAHGTAVTSWNSSNTALASVSGSGLVTGLTPGLVTLSVTAGGLTSAAFPLTVSLLPPGTYTITLEGPVTITGTVTF